MSTSDTYQLRGFGEDGVVTDLGSDRLKTSELSAAENMILPDGVPTERGGWTTLGEEDPLNDGSFGFYLGSVMAAVNLETGSTEIVVTGTSEGGGDWGYGKATSGSDGTAGSTINDGEYWVKGYYRGEALLAPRNGTSHIRRWSFRRASETPSGSTGTGTYTVADGSNQLVGSGSNFDPELLTGLYVGGGFARDTLHRVVSRTSDTKAGLASKADWDVPSQNAVMLPYGVIGLKVLVTDIGLATHTSSGTSVTGNGTKWDTAGRGFGKVEPGDWILRVGDNIANALRITSVSNDTSLTVIANSVGAFTDAAYVILRPACGREVCEYDNALWVTGVDWDPSGVYLTPPGYEPARVTNGRFGKTIQADEAMQMFRVAVPADDAPGRCLSLSATPWGLAVGRSDSIHIITGQYPSLQVRRIAELGLVDERAMVAVDDMLIFAGREGFFAWQGGRPQDLSEGRTGEWMEKARSMTRCVLGTVRGHLFISFESDDGPECWVYDLQRGVHLGNFTSEDPSLGIESAVFMDSSRIPGEEDRLLFVVVSIDRNQVQDASTTIIGPGEENTVPDENLGPLSIWTGSNLSGPLSRRTRATGAKVTYVCEGDDPGAIEVRTRIDGGAATSETNLPETGEAPSTRRIWPSSAGIGVSGRSLQMNLRRLDTATSVRRVSVREVETVVRARRPRG